MDAQYWRWMVVLGGEVFVFDSQTFEAALAFVGTFLPTRESAVGRPIRRHQPPFYSMASSPVAFQIFTSRTELRKHELVL
jgi:hypothetical protein